MNNACLKNKNKISFFLVLLFLTVIMPTAQSVQAATLPIVKSGAKGTLVYTIQYLLNYRSYGLTVDGDFGAATTSAVKRFQTANGLSSDGIVGANTWSKLFVTVRSGNNNNAVRALQYLLKNKYGYSIAVDGSFGPATDSAVRNFQSKYNLGVDGIVGTNTWNALVSGQSTPTPPPVTTPGKARDLINKAITQIGYTEGANNATKYGTWYGLSNQPWYAMFISWCANQVSIPTSVIPKFASCNTGVSWFKNAGRFKYRSSYTPKPGDIIFFGTSSNSSHVGIVESVSNGVVRTIEGNTSNMVARRSYSLTNTSIIGYGTPNY